MWRTRSFCVGRTRRNRLWAAWYKRHRTRGAFTDRVKRLANERSEGKCEKCGMEFEKATDPNSVPTIDHIIPRSKGGKNKLDNAQVLCLAPCHKEKSREEQQMHLAHSRLSRVLLTVAIQKGYQGECKCFDPASHEEGTVFTMLTCCLRKDAEKYLRPRKHNNKDGG